jgi:hypothetical protein
MAEDENVSEGLFRAISTPAALRDFEALKEGYPVLAGWSSPADLARYVTAPGRVFGRNQLLGALVRAVQRNGSASRLAIGILWLVFSPALQELAVHYCRVLRDELSEVLGVVRECFAVAIRNARCRAESAPVSEVLERTTLDVRARLEGDRARRTREVYCDPQALAEIGASEMPWDEERLGHLYEILRPDLGEDVNLLFAVAVFGLSFTDVVRCTRRAQGTVRRRFKDSCLQARELLHATRAVSMGSEPPGVAPAAGVSVEQRAPLIAAPSRGPARSPASLAASSGAGTLRELQFTVEVVLPQGHRGSAATREVRYCNVCRRWGPLRGTHLCGASWFENLEDLLKALEQGEAR